MREVDAVTSEQTLPNALKLPPFKQNQILHHQSYRWILEGKGPIHAYKYGNQSKVLTALVHFKYVIYTKINQSDTVKLCPTHE